MKNSFCLLLIGWTMLSCTIDPEKNIDSSKITNLSLDYATKFELATNGDITVTEPWPGANKPIIYSLPAPPKRVVVTSTTHLPYLELLGVENTLVGFAGTQYISSEKINQRVKEGKVAEVGVDGQLNLELLLNVAPDLVIAFDMGGESTQLDKLTESGIQVIYNADFLESSALGRAEWIKFFGAIFDKQALADSIFNEISFTYQSMKKLTSMTSEKPTLFTGVMYGDTWFLPGGQNWASQFYKDAGGQYIWAADSSSGWMEISFESVFEKAGQADFWIGISTFKTLDELASQDSRYAEFQSFKKGNVYSYNKKIGQGGGFDFFESGYARPDIVLADLISILHPELLPDYESYYFQHIR